MPEFRATRSQQSISMLKRTDILPLFYLTPPCDAIPPSRTLQLISSCAPDGCLFFHLSFFLFVLLPTPGIRTAAAGCIVETQFKSDLHHVLPAIGFTAPTHEQNDYYDSMCKHALRAPQEDIRVL